ncbi:receptor-type tyrosine-protein phosphatase epsilon-like [Corticium candelabrum]|uniref:receptor-type tyrosine-protein phosphatase epsilon-like n=1 Tax=Corticium candelabrum TaxID=121492 RepID=UPI002E256C24|nr:receptor-type tyrosine-protein phosphatase epsilon-like [Corticium candelabrum]
MVYYNGTNSPFNTTNSTKILLTGLTPYTAYEVRVAAVFRPLGASDSSYDVRSNMSNAMDFVTLRPKPSIPLDVLVDEGSLTASSAKIVWTAPATPNGLIAYYTVSYVIGQFSVANTSSAVKTLKGADKNLNFTLENLNSCSWYTTWVQATKEEKGKLLESDTSTVATFKTLASATEPARNVTIEKTGATNATISWSSPSCNATKPLKNYKIFLESNKTAIQPDINQPKMDISNLSSSVVLRSLMPLRTYYVWVAAIYENSTTGESITKTSKPKTFQTLPPSSSSPPLNVGASNVTSSSVVVTWSRPKDVFGIIAKYDVSIHSLETNSRARRSKKILEVNGQDNSIFIASLHPYTKYTAKVRAGTEIPANSSHYLWSNSNSNNFTTDVSEPPVPRNLSIASNLTKDYGGKVLITIPGIDNTNGPIDAVEIIVVELKSGVVWSHDKPLPKNKTDGVVTITAFTIPPNKTDQTILTEAKTSKIPMLKAGTSYAFYLRWTVENSTRKLTSTSKATIYSTKPIPTELVTVAAPSPTFLLSSSPSTLTPSSSPASTSTASFSSASTSTASASSSASTSTASSSSASRTPVSSSSASPSTASPTYTIPIIVVILLALVILGLALGLWKMLKDNIAKTVEKAPPSDSLEQTPRIFLERIPMEDFSAINTLNARDEPPEYATCVKTYSQLEQFQDHVNKMKADENEGYIEEYEDLAEIGIDQNTDFAKSSTNMIKNRYQNIVPYDDLCVMLDDVEGMPILDTKYINASYLDGCNRSMEYIVTQGPLLDTYSDFWRMVWLQKVEIVVMLTKTVENGKNKCFQYWSDDRPKMCDGLTVEVTTINQTTNYTVREMVLKLLDEERTVTHYYFSGWPDHGVPMHATDLLGFLYRIRRKSRNCTAPLTVHCSAGVGRSGTLVAIDTLLNFMALDLKSDVKSVVANMRMRRMEIVQSVTQYILIHDAVLEAYNTSKTEIPISEFSSKLASLQSRDSFGRREIEEEFNTLLKLTDHSDKSTFHAALLPSAARRKNRNSRFLPPDICRVILHVDYVCNGGDYANVIRETDQFNEFGENGADYINASFVNGYYKPNLFIVTQAPLSDTMADMWKMVYEQNVNAIVNLARPHEYEQYWPDSDSRTFGQVKVDLLSSKERNSLKIYDLKVTKRQASCNTMLFHYTAWPAQGYPSDPAALIDLMRQLDQRMKSTNGRRVIVHCCTGMGRTGVFCAAYNVLDQLQSEGVVNILHMSKDLHNQRPGIIHTSEQYESIYSIVDAYRKHDSIYHNISLQE